MPNAATAADTTLPPILNPSTDKPVLPVSVIITCQKRTQHLFNQLISITNGSHLPQQIVLVNDDVDSQQLSAFALPITRITPAASHSGKFDIGHNRNLGAAQASHSCLVFLDVDCLIDRPFLYNMYHKLNDHLDALIMGQPWYLKRALSRQQQEQLAKGTMPMSDVHALALPNPNRPYPSEDLLPYDDYALFWSLCFAISKPVFEQLGGFEQAYTGYGAEDTDFAFKARQAGVPFYLSNDKTYHQQHGVYRPPLNHLDSILVNANVFYQRWQNWPMGSWLDSFAQMGLIDWSKQQTTPIVRKRPPSDAELAAAHHPDAPFV